MPYVRPLLAALTVVLLAVQGACFTFGLGPDPLSLAMTAPFLGGILLPCVAVMVVAVRGSIPAADAVMAGLVMAFATLVMPVFVCGTAAHLHRVADWQLFALDRLTGLEAGRLTALVFRRIPVLATICRTVYNLLPLVVLVSAAIEAQGRRFVGHGVLPSFLLAPCLGFLAYLLVPAVGPWPFIGSGFSSIDPTLPATLAGFHDPAAARNAFPSLHTTWVVLGFIATRHQQWPARAVSGLLMVATLLATLGFGQHYLVDLIAAMPLVLLVRALTTRRACARPGARMQAAAVGSGLLLGWCLLIRAGVQPAQHETALAVLLFVTAGLPILLLVQLGRGETAAMSARSPRDRAGDAACAAVLRTQVPAPV